MTVEYFYEQFMNVLGALLVLGAQVGKQLSKTAVLNLGYVRRLQGVREEATGVCKIQKTSPK
jgi:hypothetical protein